MSGGRYYLSTLMVLLCCSFGWSQEKVTTEVLKAGLGDSIKVGEIAVVAYKLELKDGTLVDSRGETSPYEFVVGSSDVIVGFSQAVEGMKVHERRKAVIPPSLGYQGRELGAIPPNSTLYYQITLLQIVKPDNDHDHEHGEEHFEGDGHDHSDDENLSVKMLDKEFLSRRNAQKIQRPAMYEFLIRDFFTKPWRYDDGYLRVWQSTAKIALALVLLFVVGAAGRRKGYWT